MDLYVAYADSRPSILLRQVGLGFREFYMLTGFKFSFADFSTPVSCSSSSWQASGEVAPTIFSNSQKVTIKSLRCQKKKIEDIYQIISNIKENTIVLLNS